MSWKPRDYVIDHMDRRPTAAEEKIIDRYSDLHKQFKRSRGTAKVELVREMLTVLKPLGLTVEQCRAIIAEKDSFDLF